MGKGKNVKYTVRMSETESRKLERWTRKAGLSKAEYIRKKLFGKEPCELPEPAFWAHLEELYKIHGRIKDPSTRKDLEQFILTVQKESTQGKEVCHGNDKPVEN